MVSGCQFRFCGSRPAHCVIFRNRGAHVAALGTSTLTQITWSTVSGFKGLENDVVVLGGVKDIDDDWHQGIAYVGISRARTGLHVIIQEDCDERRREQGESDVEMLL